MSKESAMSSYRSYLWSRKAGIVERVFRPAANDGEALLKRISRMGKVALRLRGLRTAAAPATPDPGPNIRAAARYHLMRAQRLIRELGEPDIAAQTAILRDSLK
jgi:hypothetical protein